jgi:quercetin dioxygenase-like cupin family protein
MEPNIRNRRSANLAEGAARLVALDDNPTTCTLSYSRIEPGKTSSHHMHPWEHEVYIIKGSGTLNCDGKEYPVKEGDAMFIPGNVDHYTLNDGGQGDILRIEINPMEAARSGGARNEGGTGTGQPPVIRNHRDLNADTGSRILNTKDGVPNYVMLYNGPMMPGAVSHAEAGGHTHAWDHVIYVLEGSGTLRCDGQDYAVTEGDAVLVPPNSLHQWKNETDSPMLRVTFNAIESVAHEG